MNPVLAIFLVFDKISQYKRANASPQEQDYYDQMINKVVDYVTLVTKAEAKELVQSTMFNAAICVLLFLPCLTPNCILSMILLVAL